MMRMVPIRKIRINRSMLEQSLMHLLPHVRAMDRVVFLAREQLRMFPSEDVFERHLGLGRQLPVRVPGPVGSVHEVVDEGRVVTLGPDPEPAHGIEEAAFGTGFVDRVAGAAVAQFDAGWVEVNGFLHGLYSDREV